LHREPLDFQKLRRRDDVSGPIEKSVAGLRIGSPNARTIERNHAHPERKSILLEHEGLESRRTVTVKVKYRGAVRHSDFEIAKRTAVGKAKQGVWLGRGLI
jgi:hypothetical protein